MPIALNDKIAMIFYGVAIGAIMRHGKVTYLDLGRVYYGKDTYG